MHVVLPELDGRMLAGAVAFKDPLPAQEGLGFHRAGEPARSRPGRDGREPDRGIGPLARIAARGTPRRGADAGLSRRAGRTGYAVGLDVPASVTALIEDLAAAGYAVAGAPQTPRDLLDALSAGAGDATLTLRNTRICWRGCRQPRSRACAKPGAIRRPIRTCATARSIFAPKIRQALGGAAARSRSLRANGAPTITIRNCRRAMRWSLSDSGCNTWRRPMRSYTWARTARWNGCRAKRSR